MEWNSKERQQMYR
jgi:hypothetical protein